jgi:adenylate cyclase
VTESGKAAQPADAAEDETAALLDELGLGPDRAELVGSLRELGISTEALRRALERGRLEDAVFDAVIDPERAGRSESPRQVAAAGGPSLDELTEMMQAFGLARPDPDEPLFTPEESRALIEMDELRELWPPRLYMQAARVWSLALSRMARTEMALFRLQVEPGLRHGSEDAGGSLAAIRTAFERLLPVADTLLVGMHRRWVEHELAAAAAFEAEARAGGHALPGAVQLTILFCDLKDFTAYADTEGDEAAVGAIERFARTVYERRGAGGEIVKALGDGYMLAYPTAAEAVEAASRIAAEARRQDLPAVHASAHTGVAIQRDGDYFGSAVNTAARLLGESGADELLASGETAEAADGEIPWEPRGQQAIRGLRDPVEVVSLTL